MSADKNQMFINNCPIHTPVTVSNVTIVDIIAPMKRAHMRYIMGEIMTAMMASENITELAKKVAICYALLNTKVPWNTLSDVVICKWFRKCGIHKEMGHQQQHQADELLDFPALLMMLNSKTC